MNRTFWLALGLTGYFGLVFPARADEALDWYLRGNDLSRAGRYTEAVDAYLKAIQKNPRATGPFYNLGIAFKKLRQYDRAVAAFEAARQREPENLHIRFQLGSTYNLMERWQEAIGHLNYVVHRAPNHAEAHGNLGWAYLNYDRGPPFKLLVILNLEKAARLFEQQGLHEAAQATRETLNQARKKFGYDAP